MKELIKQKRLRAIMIENFNNKFPRLTYKNLNEIGDMIDSLNSIGRKDILIKNLTNK